MSFSTIASWIRRRMSVMSWLARSGIALSSVDCIGVARQRCDADIEIGEQGKVGQELVQLVDRADVEHADVRVAAGDAPQMRPATVALERLGVLALACLELVGLRRRHVSWQANFHLRH